MKRNLSYMRCCPNEQSASTPWLGAANHATNLQALEWADGFKYGKVTIGDIALATTAFDKPATGVFGQTVQDNATDAYYAHPFYSSTPSAHKVDIGDISVAAFYFDDGLFSPFNLLTNTRFTPVAPPQLAQYGSITDPYFYQFSDAINGNPNMNFNGFDDLTIVSVTVTKGTIGAGSLLLTATSLGSCTGTTSAQTYNIAPNPANPPGTPLPSPGQYSMPWYNSANTAPAPLTSGCTYLVTITYKGQVTQVTIKVP
jgi:hypothetical protein